MANYSNDADLLRMRPDILNLGETDWENMHTEAKAIIDRQLESRWYKEHATEQGVDWTATPFNSDYVDTTHLNRLSCYKTLELIYQYLMTQVEGDTFEKFMLHFREQYERELQTILSLGLGYDWDASGAIESDERLQPRIRRLQRM